jgi:hypothetical protein
MSYFFVFVRGKFRNTYEGQSCNVKDFWNNLSNVNLAHGSFKSYILIHYVYQSVTGLGLSFSCSYGKKPQNSRGHKFVGQWTGSSIWWSPFHIRKLELDLLSLIISWSSSCFLAQFVHSRLLRVEIRQDCARILVFDAEKNIGFAWRRKICAGIYL